MNANAAVILHVEDDPNDRTLIELAFARAGLNVTLRSVTDGEAAIAYLKGEEIYGDRARYPLPDVLILDLKLPRKNGFEVLEWIRQNHATSDLTVLILSSSTQSIDVARARANCASDYFVKPVSFHELERMIKQIGAKWITPQSNPALSEGAWNAADFSDGLMPSIHEIEARGLGVAVSSPLS